MSINFDVQIKCDNDAFQRDASIEVARLLRSIADKVEAGYISLPILTDSNGNRCGQAGFNPVAKDGQR